MKAVKLSKIQWNLSDLSPEEREEVKKTLPTVKGFKAPDDFKVAEKVPVILKKKYGYEIIDFTFTQVHIIEDVKQLFLLGLEGDVIRTKPFFKKGKLTEFGEECVAKLGELIRRRLRLQEHGTDPSLMPKILDQLMISWEAITGLNWEDYDNYDDIMGPIMEELRGTTAVNLKDPDEMEEETDADGETE